MLRHGLGIGAGGNADRDLSTAGRRDIDFVVPHSMPGNDLQRSSRFDNRFGYFRQPDNHAGGVRDFLKQGGAVIIRQDPDFIALLEEELNAGVVYRNRNENLRFLLF